MCIDGDWPRGRGPAPVGAARLPWTAAEAADATWVSGPIPEDLPDSPSVHVQMRPTGWLHKGEQHPLDAVQGPVHARAGIARPERFVCTLLEMGLEIQSLALASDHGTITDLPPGAVITEKDAARLPPDADVWALVLTPEVSNPNAIMSLVEGLNA